MKLLQNFPLAKTLGISLLLINQSTAAPDCGKVGAKVQADVAAKPERVLLIVEDAIVQHESCACEILKAAIVASKAQPKLVGQIVFTAVSASNGVAATVSECAVSVAPDAASEIKNAVQKALSDKPETAQVTQTTVAPANIVEVTDGKNPVGKEVVGKNPGKEVVAPETPSEEADFGSQAAMIGGVYLVVPGGGSSMTSEEMKKFLEQIRRAKSSKDGTETGSNRKPHRRPRGGHVTPTSSDTPYDPKK